MVFYHQYFKFPQFSFIFVLHYSMTSKTITFSLSYDPMVFTFVKFDEDLFPRSRRTGSNSVSRWRGRYKGEFTKPGNRKCKHHYLNLIFIVRATERCNRNLKNRFEIFQRFSFGGMEISSSEILRFRHEVNRAHRN